MPRKIFVNLPIRDLKKSMEFFGKLGFKFNPQFTDETATSMIISDDIYVMLLTHEKFRTFIANKEIADSTKTTEALIALSFDSREEVDKLVDAAIAAGGKPFREPADHGFMYERSFEDLDGHVWEPFWMDSSFVQPQA
ncbi:MAG: VOC family protein [Planctomycetales bacterium]|nr:VOC family protein [Planctomycetales bacterium]MBN8623939.1 VOC family protein [Planctomycetota bacterium]